MKYNSRWLIFYPNKTTPKISEKPQVLNSPTQCTGKIVVIPNRIIFVSDINKVV